MYPYYTILGWFGKPLVAERKSSPRGDGVLENRENREQGKTKPDSFDEEDTE